MPHSDSWPARLRAAADAITAESPPLPDGWPRRGRVRPSRQVVLHLLKAGWPRTSVTLELEQTGHDDASTRGQPVGTVWQDVTCVPVSWVAELARRMGATVRSLTRGEVADDI